MGTLRYARIRRALLLQRNDIPEAKRRLPLPQLLEKLGLGDHAKKSARCPFHEDQKASFSIWEGKRGWHWKCHGSCDARGDEIDLLMRREDLSKRQAIRRYVELAGVPVAASRSRRPRPVAEAPRVEQPERPERPTSVDADLRAACQPSTPEASHIGERWALRARSTHRARSSRSTETGRSASELPTAPPVLPPDIHAGTRADWQELAERRHLTIFATARASSLGTLRFATLFGHRCWLLTDRRQLCAEARRMDGECFPPLGPIGERKAHTLKGSVKNWPVGLMVQDLAVDNFRAVLAVEGGPDYLAALDCTLAAESDCLPIAFLGAGIASQLHAEAIPLLRGRRIRFYPHHEESGAGRRAVDKWATQLRALGCECDAFNFAGLRRDDGQPVKDLNDLSPLCAEGAPILKELLP